MSGEASTSAAGSVTPSRTVSLLGQVITCGQGLFDNPHGVVAFVEQGALAPVNNPTSLSTQLITSATGTLTPAQSTGDLTVHIGGSQQITSDLGTITPSNPLSTQAVTSGHGVVTYSIERPLTGSEIAGSTGIVAANIADDDTYITSQGGTASPAISKILTGSEITTAQGGVIASAVDKTAGISGGPLFRIQSATGTATPNISKALLGKAITTAQNNMGAPGFAELSGSSITVSQGGLGRSFPLSGQEITSAQGTIVGLPGLVALVGESMTAGQGSMEPSGTQWTPEGQPTTTWTPPASPNSSWTRKDGPSTSWNRKT
jgi:hypothetical protein